MKNVFLRALISIVAIALLATPLTPFSDAKELSNTTSNQESTSEQGTNDYSDKEVAEIENTLKVLYDDAGVYNEKTKSLQFKDSVLKNELSDSEYNRIVGDLKSNNQLISDVSEGVTKEVNQPDWRARIGNEKAAAYVDKCVGNKLSNTYGKKAAKAIATLVLNKNYKKAAKELAKRGLKASGNIVTLSSILGKCLYQANKKY